VEESRRSLVEFVSDDGVVVLLLQDGQRRLTVIPPKSVPLVLGHGLRGARSDVQECEIDSRAASAPAWTANPTVHVDR
jgi:hypothetical protein